ncbi:MAG: methyltransferase type 11 [Deltaproteobacteria bacterium GWB2_55_19]|nr:MAG: methyltransferase type 11 [Deltaproteobacteria bacterium GWB2_55_19]
MSDKNERRAFPDWEKLYKAEPVEKMPWFNPELDSDLAEALEALDIRGGLALDIGTGPGTQAFRLAEMGFEVTATDLSPTAIRKARKAAREKVLNIDFRVDNILATRLSGKFDIIFDRGCFHVLPPEQRGVYGEAVEGLLNDGGYFFLKCFSHRETKVQGGPYRFTRKALKEAFGPAFRAISIKDTVYQGTLEALPKALFSVWVRK